MNRLELLESQPVVEQFRLATYAETRWEFLNALSVQQQCTDITRMLMRAYISQLLMMQRVLPISETTLIFFFLWINLQKRIYSCYCANHWDRSVGSSTASTIRGKLPRVYEIEVKLSQIIASSQHERVMKENERSKEVRWGKEDV